MEPRKKPSLGLAAIIPAMAMIASSEDPLVAPGPRVTFRKKRKYDPRVALQYRIERMVRKASNYRRQHKLPPVTEGEIREWIKGEAGKLGLELKEQGDGDDDASEPHDQG